MTLSFPLLSSGSSGFFGTVRAALEYVRGPDLDKYISKERAVSLLHHHHSPTIHPSQITPPPLRSSPATHRSPHYPEYEPSSIEATLARLSQLKIQADQLDDPSPPHPQRVEHDELG